MTSAMDFDMPVSMDIHLRMAQLKIIMDMNIPKNNVSPQERIERDKEYVRRMEEAIRNIKKRKERFFKTIIRDFYESNEVEEDASEQHDEHSEQHSEHGESNADDHEEIEIEEIEDDTTGNCAYDA